MVKTAALRYGRVGFALVLSALILGGVFALLQGEALPATAQHTPAVSSPDTLNPTFEATGIVISSTPTGEVFFNNRRSGVLTLTFTLTGTPPLTLTAEPAFGTGYVLTSPVAPWEAVLSYTVSVTAVSQPPVTYSLTQSATVSATIAVITYTRDITGPQMTSISVQADPEVYADGTVVYYTHTTPRDVFFALRGKADDALAGPGTVSATSALGTPAPVNVGSWHDWLFTYRIPSGVVETGRITVTVADAVQNAAHLVFNYIHDPYPPTGTVKIIANGAFISTTLVPLQLTAEDGEGCGVAEMCLSNTPDCSAWRPFTPTVADWELASGDGETTVYVRYKDHLGNTSALIQASPIWKDRTPPTVTVTAPARVAVPDIEVSWTAVDEGGSGLGLVPLYTVDYREDDGDWIGGLTLTSLTHTTFSSPTVTLNHTYTFRVTAKDQAGNTGTGTAVTRAEKYHVYLPLTLKSWVWWYTYDIYEPNDTPADAWGPLRSGMTYQAYIWDATDRDDYYYFMPTASGDVGITLSKIPNNVDYDLYIYYHDGAAYQSVGHSNLTGSPEEEVKFQGVAGRKYFVRVYPYSGFDPTRSYSLVATYP